MSTPGLKTLRRTARWLQSRLVPHGIVLGYHRIAEVTDDPYELTVTPDHFRQQLEVLRRRARPTSLWNLIESTERGKVHDRSVILTFDDGYWDISHTAKRLLEESEIPAIVFIATEYIGREYWWDQLARVILDQGVPCSSIARLIHQNESKTAVLNKTSINQNSDSACRRKELLLGSYMHVLRLPHTKKEKILERLMKEISDLSSGGTATRAMTADEIINLSESDLIEIGAHSVTHPNLADLSPEMQRQEISQSKLYLEELIGEEVLCFSYPNGSATQITRRIVEETGYSCAFMSQNGIVWSGSDRYYLPRFWVPNWDGRKFEQWLETWL